MTNTMTPGNKSPQTQKCTHMTLESTHSSSVTYIYITHTPTLSTGKQWSTPILIHHSPTKCDYSQPHASFTSPAPHSSHLNNNQVSPQHIPKQTQTISAQPTTHLSTWNHTQHPKQQCTQPRQPPCIPTNVRLTKHIQYSTTINTRNNPKRTILQTTRHPTRNHNMPHPCHQYQPKRQPSHTSLETNTHQRHCIRWNFLRCRTICCTTTLEYTPSHPPQGMPTLPPGFHRLSHKPALPVIWPYHGLPTCPLQPNHTGRTFHTSPHYSQTPHNTQIHPTIPDTTESNGCHYQHLN